MKNNKRIVWIFVLLIIAVTTGIFGYSMMQNNTTVTDDIVDVDENEEEVEIIKQPQRDLWLSNKSINEDYIGELVFESGLIDKSFVQAKDVYNNDGQFYKFYTERGNLVTEDNYLTACDLRECNGNDVYIWTNWQDFTYDYNILGGSVFMDYRNTLDDQNVIIYGHHFSEAGGNDPERIKAFTPLEKLLYEQNLAGNEKLNLILDNENREYELAYVYKYDVNDEFCVNYLQYYRTSYTYDEFELKEIPEFYDNYIEGCEKYKLYDTGVHLTNKDKTLTLQTCIGGQAGYIYEVLVYRLVNTIEYTD